MITSPIILFVLGALEVAMFIVLLLRVYRNVRSELVHVWNFRVKDTSKTPDRLGEYPDVTGRWEYWKPKDGIQMIYSGKRSGKWLTYNEAFKISKTLEEYGNANVQNNPDIQK